MHNILCLPERDFRLWDHHIAQIQAISPDIRLHIVPAPEATREMVHDADIIFGWPRKSWVVDAPHLRWIQLPSSGSDGWSSVRPDILLTKSAGVFGVPIAEWVIGMMVALTHNLHRYRDQQLAAHWGELPGAEVYGSTVGIVGLGDLGSEVACRAQAMGCRVLGTRRTLSAPPPPDVDQLLPLDELLPTVDFLVLAVPNTPETQGLIDAERLRRLKPGAYLINVGRGTLVDEAALIAALASGHLAGAALDVTAQEPLPAESPLWRMEQVILTPHTSGRSPQANADRRMALFSDNLRRFLQGEPLRNQVNRLVHY